MLTQLKTTPNNLHNYCGTYGQLIGMMKKGEQLIINDKGVDEAVVLVISPKEYEAYEQFLHEQYIKRILQEAKAEADRADAVWLNEEEFWEAIETD